MATIFDKKITRLQFIERYEKEKTKKAVLASLNAFDFYRNSQHPGVDERMYFEDMEKLDEQTLYMELDRIVQFWKAGGAKGKPLAAKTVGTYFTFVRAWFRVNGIRTHDDDVKAYVKMPKILREKSTSMTHDIALKFHNNMNPKYAIYFDFICYSAMRLTEGLELQVRDIFIDEDPIRIVVRAEIAKTGVERTTFVPASMKADIAGLIGSKKPFEKLFGFTYNAYYLHYKRIRNNLGLVDKRMNGRNYKFNPYKSRKYAKTNISMATDSDFSENIMGHANGVKGTYYEAEDDTLGKMYKKAIPSLLLSKEQVYKEKYEDAEKRASQVRDLEITVQKQQDQINRLQDMIKNHG